MERYKFKIIYVLLFVSTFCACVRETDNPPGCTTPGVPGFKYARTEYNEGEEIKLEATEPAGESNGTFEWQGPNKYFITQQQFSISNAKDINEGEYKLYYLNENRCRSKPASIYISVLSYTETCGLNKNIVRNQDALQDMRITNLQQGIDAQRRYFVTGTNDTIQIKIVFPGQQRPSANKTFTVAAKSGGALASNEVDLLILNKGRWYNAIPVEGKKVNTIVTATGLHIAYCSHVFTDNIADTVVFSGNIVVP